MPKARGTTSNRMLFQAGGQRSGVARSQGVWTGLGWVGQQGWRGKLGTNCCRVSRLSNLWATGSPWQFSLFLSPQAYWFPIAGLRSAAPPTAFFYKPVLAFQEKAALLS